MAKAAPAAAARGGWAPVPASAASRPASTSSGGGTAATAFAPPPQLPSALSPPPSSRADWLATRLGPPALRRYAAHFGLSGVGGGGPGAPAPPPAWLAGAAATHWEGHALLDEAAVAGAFMRAASRRAA